LEGVSREDESSPFAEEMYAKVTGTNRIYRVEGESFVRQGEQFVNTNRPKNIAAFAKTYVEASEELEASLWCFATGSLDAPDRLHIADLIAHVPEVAERFERIRQDLHWAKVPDRTNTIGPCLDAIAMQLKDVVVAVVRQLRNFKLAIPIDLGAQGVPALAHLGESSHLEEPAAVVVTNELMKLTVRPSNDARLFRLTVEVPENSLDERVRVDLVDAADRVIQVLGERPLVKAPVDGYPPGIVRLTLLPSGKVLRVLLQSEIEELASS
jgi:hypothetical protein